MSNSIDLGAIALGACLGYGLRKELKSTAGVCKSALLAAATVAAATTAAAVEDVQKSQNPQSETQQPQGQGQSNGGTV